MISSVINLNMDSSNSIFPGCNCCGACAAGTSTFTIIPHEHFHNASPRYPFHMIHSDHFCVVAILRLRAVRRLQKLNPSLGHANREAERPVGARAVHPRGGPIFVHGFLEDYAVYAVLAKKKCLAIGMLIFLWMKHPHSACYFFCGACTQACR